MEIRGVIKGIKIIAKSRGENKGGFGAKKAIRGKKFIGRCDQGMKMIKSLNYMIPEG